MKKLVSLTLAVIGIFTMVYVVFFPQDTLDNKDIFAFNLPNGFVISDVAEQECYIINEKGLCIGGFVITELKKKDIKDMDDISLAQYLDKIHKGSEYIAWNGEDTNNPVIYINQSVKKSNLEENKEWYRVLFEKNSYVYDMWFDTDMIDSDTIEEFVCCVVEQ